MSSAESKSGEALRPAGRWGLRGLTGRVLLLLGSTLIGLLLAEVVLRSARAGGEGMYLFTTESKRYKVVRPDFHGVAYGVPFRTNSLGFRDDSDRVPEKAADEFRVIVLGDSFTFSPGVPYDSIFTSRLERRLAERRPGSRVVNLACSGYNILQYYLTLEEVGLELGPDLVLTALYVPNDFSMRGYEVSRKLATGELSSVREALPLWKRFEVSLLLVTWGRETVRKLRAGPSGEAAGPGWEMDGWETNLDALAAIADTARRRGIPALTVLLPGNFEYARQRWAHDKVLEGCRSRGVDCVDALDAFLAAGQPPSSFTVHLIDSHPNPDYHELVTDLLVRALAERGLPEPL